MPTVMITGASRGLGLEFVKQYLAEGWRVIATYRTLSPQLRDISDRLMLERLDITASAEVAQAAEKLKNIPVDLLINNAGAQGVNGEGATFGALDVSAWLEIFHANAIAPMKVTEAFMQSVRQSNRKQIVFISSRAGSISERGMLPHHKRGGSYLYRTSKAALNSGAKNLAFDLKPFGISVLVLHPGWVRTDSGGANADLEVSFSVREMRKVIDSFSIQETGSFKDYAGRDISW